MTSAFGVLVNYLFHLLPGLLLFGVWWAATPRSLVAMRILILLAAFVLMRDAMTPLDLWAVGSDVQIAFSANTLVLGALGCLSLLLIMLLARTAPELWRLVVWVKGSGLAGVVVYLVGRLGLRLGAYALRRAGGDADPRHGNPVDCRALYPLI